jgi:hypothetical protein
MISLHQTEDKGTNNNSKTKIKIKNHAGLYKKFCLNLGSSIAVGKK